MMARKHKSFIGLAIALVILAAAAVTGGLLAKADGQTWTSSADTAWYNPVYTTFKIDSAAKLAGVAKLVNEDPDGSIDGLRNKILEIDRNLDLSAHLWVPIGTGEHPFHGTLISKDGAMLTLSGMRVEPGMSYQGLVGNMDGGTVGGFEFDSNGSISVTSVTYDVYAGAAVGKMTGNSTVYDITNKMKIETISSPYKAYTGGIVGMGTGTVSNSVNQASITGNGASAVGGIIGYSGPGNLKMKKVSNSGAVLANSQGGTSYAGGIAGYTSGSLIMNDEDTMITNSAAVEATGGDIVYAGGIIGKTDGTVVYSNATTSSGAVNINAPAAAGSYAGGLIGGVGAVQNPDISINFVHSAPVTNNGGTNVYTGAIVGHADSPLTWAAGYKNTNPVTATGSQNIYTGGYIGFAAHGLILNNPAPEAYQNTAVITVSGGTVVYTGGIAGYDAGGSITHASFAGTMNVTGAANVYTGGIAGYEIGGTLAASQAGDTAGHFNEITSDGTLGGIAGYLEGTISNSTVKHLTLRATSQGGIIGGIAGSAQGTITGVLAGDPDSTDYNSLRFEASVATPAPDGRDNITAGGIVGMNDKALILTNSKAAKTGFISAAARSGYTFGGIAGRLNTAASIGTAAQAIEASDILVEMKADQLSFGGAVGSNLASALYLHTNRIDIRAEASKGYAGGIFGENHGTSPYVLAENITISSPGTDNAVGGITGFNTGTLTDATSHSVVITASGLRTEAGGIAGRSEGIEGNRASLITPVMLAGENALITITGTDVQAGGIAGFARATDIVQPLASAIAPDYVIFSIKGTGAKAGGLAGTLENSTISGDSTALNAENLLMNSTIEGTDAFIGGLVGYNDKSRLERLVGKSLNLTLSGPNVKAGGMTGYNLGTNTAVIANNYITALSLKTNASAGGSIVGGIVGLNEARGGDPVQNPGTAVSTIQNSRTLGSISAVSPSSVIGGMVGENRSLIANNSITDKLPVSSKGNNAIFGGLAGRNTATGTLYYTYSNANMTIEGAGTLAGGLVGDNAGQVKGSYVDIDITGKAMGNSSQYALLGGLIGRNSAGSVEQSYSSSKVTANGGYTVVGGLVGEHAGGNIKNSYVAKSVNAIAEHSYAGGLIGRITNGKVSNTYSAAEVIVKGGAYAGGFAGRYDNASKELLYKSYYIKDGALNINTDLPDFAEGNHRWLDVHVRLTTILSETLRDRNIFPGLSGWDFNGAWKYGSLNAEYKYPEVNREANTGGDAGGGVNSSINWYMKDKDAIGFQISSEAELAGLASIVNGTIVGVEPFDFAGRTITVMNPIHIQSKQWTPIGETEEHAFQGTLDGGSHLIDGLTMQSAVYSNSGLFGVIGDEGTVKNMNLEPLSIAGNQYTGGIAGQNKGTVSNIDLKLLNGNKISGGTVGGIIGKNTGSVSALHLTLDGGSRIETLYTGGLAGGIIGDNTAELIYTADSDSTKVLAVSTYLLTSVDGSIGSSADQAVIGGIIGRQSGNVTGMNEEVSSKYRITSTGADSITGGLIGHFASGSAKQLTVTFTDGQLEAKGLDSVLGGLAGHADSQTVLSNVKVQGPGTGIQLSGNGTVGGAVGVKDGAAGGMTLTKTVSASNSYDMDQVEVRGVALSAVEGSLQAVIGGITGEATDAALNNLEFSGSVQSSGEANMAGGIVGHAVNTLLYHANAAAELSVTAKNGETAVGGIAGSLSADDLNAGYDFGKPYPLYRGIYLAKANTGTIRVTGSGNTADLYAGGIAGKNTNASIYRSEAASGLSVTGGNTVNVGGIAGYSSGIIVDSSAASSLNADSSREYNVGGIVGWGEGGQIHYSKITAADGEAITVGTALTLGESVPATRAGGLVGLGDYLIITNSHADIPLRITDTNQDNTIYAGGFAGLLGDRDTREGHIERSYATGALTVSGKLGSYIGGFAGSVDHFSIKDAYASGNISNTGFDTRSGGFAGTVERNAVISESFALQAKISTVGVKSSTRSYTGGFAGYNDGTLTGVYANVPDIAVNVTGPTVYAGQLAGYNFRDGKINSSTFSPKVSELPAIGRNAGAVPEAVPVDAWNPLASGKWSIDVDTSFMDQAVNGTVTLSTPQQLKGAVLLYNETGVAYYRLYNRTATEGMTLNKLLLAADMDLGGTPWTSFDSFIGVLDGQGHTLYGLQAGTAEHKYSGFVSENYGEIANVNFADARIEAGTDAGIIAGINHSGASIHNVNLSGSVLGSEAAGGAAGMNQGTLAAIRAMNLKIEGKGYAGGIAGTNEGIINKSSSAGSVSTTGPAAGGIAGWNASQGTISDSMSYVDVSAIADQTAAGGISGLNAGELTNTYASGRIRASGTLKAWAGGIAGHHTEGSIVSSLNTGEITAVVNGEIRPQQAFFGGITGQKDNGATISRSVFNRQMLKRNIAYYDSDGKSKAGDPVSEGLPGSELVKMSLPGVLDAAHWKAHEGFYPVLNTFDGTDEGVLGSAAVILSPQDLINRVNLSFALSSGRALTWTANPAQAVISAASGKLQTSGSALLTATLNGSSRSITVNEAAVKFPEPAAAAPTVVSGDKVFYGQVSVVLATNEPGGIIYYTLDGNLPTEYSQRYNGPIVLTTATNIRAITIVDNKEYSKELNDLWSPPFAGGGGGGAIIPPVKEPAISAIAGITTTNGDSEAPVKVAKNSKLKLTAPEGQTIYYTTDGSTPTVNSKKYTAEILITGNMTIKMITDKDDTVITIEYEVENAKYKLKNDASEVKYMTAPATGMFAPNKAITRYETIAALAPLLDMEEVNVGNLFNDVTAENQALTAFFASAGIIEGYPDGGFGGTKGLTRAEFSKILTTVLHLDVTKNGVTKQADLKGHWSEKYVNALSKAGYVQGFPDGTFKPGDSITRAQAVVMINRIIGAKRLNVTTVRFKDLPATHWAYNDIMSVVK